MPYVFFLVSFRSESFFKNSVFSYFMHFCVSLAAKDFFHFDEIVLFASHNAPHGLPQQNPFVTPNTTELIESSCHFISFYVRHNPIDSTQPIYNPRHSAIQKPSLRLFAITCQFVANVGQSTDIEQINHLLNSLIFRILDASQENMNCYTKQADFARFEPFKVRTTSE